MILDLDQRDIERIAEAVAERLGPQSPQAPWLTRAEAAEYLRCSVRQVDKLARLGEIAVYRPSGRPLYARQDLEAFVTNRRES